MELHFKKAPVVEISVQVQWLPKESAVVPPQSSTVIELGGDDFFQEFGSRAAEAGFLQSERIVPAGVRVSPHQPVYRYRKGPDSTVVYQLGQGIFSINAVPPYKTWDHFFPHVVTGMSMLMESLPDEQKNDQFFSVQVRYINMFEGEILRGLSPTRFIMDTLKWHVSLPTALYQNVDASEVDGFFVRLGFKVSDSIHLLINVGEVLRHGTPAALLDLVTEVRNIEQVQEEVLAKAQDMHTVIHKTFLDMVAPIQDLFEPEWHDIQ